MADKIPVKARYSGSDVISLGELETGDTINASYISNLPSGLPATGVDGNVLTSDGTNWASETPAGGGAWTLITTISHSSTGNYNNDIAAAPTYFTFTGLDSSTYMMYALQVNNCRNWNNGQKMELSFGNASGYGLQNHFTHYMTGSATNVATGSYVWNARVQGGTAETIAMQGVSSSNYLNSGNAWSGHYYISPGTPMNNAQAGESVLAPYPTIWGGGVQTYYNSGETGGQVVYDINMCGSVKYNAAAITQFRLGYTGTNKWMDGSASLYGITRV